jgi:hypothetical protein
MGKEYANKQYAASEDGLSSSLKITANFNQKCSQSMFQQTIHSSMWSIKQETNKKESSH